jgi:hypothetical protein
MKSAYNETAVYNLEVIKETKRWSTQGLLDSQQFATIKEQYTTALYHPNFIIRILLFIATVIALSGVTGLLALMVFEGSNEDAVYVATFIYGIALFFFVEMVFIKQNHFKSGVNEALIYAASLFTIIGITQIMDSSQNTVLAACLVVLLFSAIRYVDVVCTVGAVLAFGGFIFNLFYSIGGIFQNIIPFVFIITFTGIYFWVKHLKTKNEIRLWRNCLLLVECLSLLFIYAAGNYLVVRELSAEFMNLYLEEGDDIPFAFFFYALTVFIPLTYLFFGIKNKNVALLRVSLFVLAFSVFTFKYYYSLGHPEISLTIAGAFLLGVAILLLNYLKIMRGGFTRENILSEKWGNANVEAFIISQTTGGNVTGANAGESPGGGSFGGGGASTDF